VPLVEEQGPSGQDFRPDTLERVLQPDELPKKCSEPKGEIGGLRIGFVLYGRFLVRHGSVHHLLDVGVDGGGVGFLSASAEGLDLAQGSVIATLDGRGVALQFVEHVTGHRERGEDAAVGTVGGTGFGESLLEGFHFEAFDASHLPAGLNHLVDEERLSVPGGQELGTEGGGELVEGGVVLVREDS
jgi:hypothetical protein